jgi:integrase
VAELIPLTLAACQSQRTRDLYARPLELLGTLFGHLPANAVKPSDLRQYVAVAQDRAVRRRTSVDGRSAAEHAVAAARALFAVAIQDGLPLTHNPALAVRKPARQQALREGLTDDQLSAVFDVVSDDETLVLRLLLEMAVRRAELCELKLAAVQVSRQTIKVIGKGTKVREQPITAGTLDAILDRESLVYNMTRRRFDGLWARVRRELDFAEELGLATHDLRRAAITRFEAATGSYALAAAFAGHHLTDTTSTYLKITLRDVAAGFEKYTGEAHPLAR